MARVRKAMPVAGCWMLAGGGHRFRKMRLTKIGMDVICDCVYRI